MGGSRDAFVAKLDATGSTLLWSTFLGGMYFDYLYDLALDAAANPVVTGETESPDFPTTPDGYDQTFNGGYDVFVSRFDASGSSLLWSTYMGGAGATSESGSAVVLALGGGVILAGQTGSPDFPTTPGAYDVTQNGGSDAFLAKLNVSAVTPVEDSFTATVTESGTVVLRWIAGSLDRVVGLNLYRRTTEQPFVRINESPIAPSSPGEFEDATVWPETTFWYELRALLVDGSEEVAGPPPASATTGGRLAARLHAAYPNPVVREATVVFDVPSHGGPASLAVYNVRGQLVRALSEGVIGPGRHVARWDGTDSRGGRVPSGVYFLKLNAGEEVQTEKVLVLR
jgi:hypothetical protein